MFENIDMTDAALVKELGIGCLKIKGTHLWALSHYVWESTAKNVGVTFFCDCGSPWQETGLIRFEVFKLPGGKSEFAERADWYTGDRKKRAVKISDGMKFEESMLHFKTFGDWEQDSFALSKGEIIRIYKQPKFAVIVRFLARSGTLLDHPIFKRAVKNLTFDKNLWEKTPPDIADKRPQKLRITEYAFDEEQECEMLTYVDQSMARLKFTKTADARKRMGVVEKEIMTIRARKKLTEEELVETAIELGYLIGQIFCQEQNWDWCIVSAPKEEDSICICNENRALAIEPIEWIYRLMAEKAPLNCLLMYNMIEAGRLPPSRPRSYSRIN